MLLGSTSRGEELPVKWVIRAAGPSGIRDLQSITSRRRDPRSALAEDEQAGLIGHHDARRGSLEARSAAARQELTWCAARCSAAASLKG